MESGPLTLQNTGDAPNESDSGGSGFGLVLALLLLVAFFGLIYVVRVRRHDRPVGTASDGIVPVPSPRPPKYEAVVCSL